MIETRGLRKSFTSRQGREKKTVEAVRGVDLDVAPGERVLLLGPSGSGKSTLLAGLAGLLDPSVGEQEGELLLDGAPARAARARAVRAATHGSGVPGTAATGLLLQDPVAQTVLARAGDDVAFGLENHGVPRELIGPRVERALAAVGFPYGPRHPTARLSGGERQRLALAGVLALRPGLLLLDEPTAMLDPDGARLLRDQVGRVLDDTGAGCVVVEHRVAPWLPLVDRVVVLDPGGGVAADGDPAQVLAREGARLARAGVWVPGHLPVAGRAGRPTGRPAGAGAAAGAAGGVLVEAVDLAVTRPARARAGGPPVLAGLGFAVREGEALCLRGRNGAGKSTLARVLGGLVPPAGGELVASAVLRGGLGPHPHRWRSRELVSRIGSVFQEPQHQFVAGTVADELAVGPRRLGLPGVDVDRRVAQLLDRLGLTPLARANPFTLSGGEQRRLSVGTVLATRPRVLVLDEPTFGQDARTWTALADLLAELLDAGAAVVAATHDEALVEALDARVLPLPGPLPGPLAAPAGTR